MSHGCSIYYISINVLFVSPFFQAIRTSCLGQQRPNVLERQEPISVLSADTSGVIFAAKKKTVHPKQKIIFCKDLNHS